MYEEKPDVIQGTLDMLILKTLSLQPMHGFGIARRIEQISQDVSAVREDVRGYGWESAVETLLGDARFALRRLRADAGFTVGTLLTLSLGIGGTTAIFSAVKERCCT